MLTGKYSIPTPFERLIAAAGYALIAVLLLPWAAIAIGLVQVGLLSIGRGDANMLIALPAGLAIPAAFGLLLALSRYWYPLIREFEYENGILVYSFGSQKPKHSRSIEDIRYVQKCYRRRGRRWWGFVVRFKDRSCIVVSRRLTDAEQLFIEIETLLLNRATSA